MTFEIKLANGHEAVFDSAEELSNWFERMVPRVNKKRKETVESKTVQTEPASKPSN